ncbi:hypothetical protein NXH64_06320 [Butyrivibrio fibrisolvens]|uniref:hypothetical protein n=1 Tax=Pseudobutyrivibrio ruminis TaxID=46206 RepID=UPI0004036BA0|nr:hypothetical protein [Pseudobutyrivibrio ruminis]MDC7279121.1 hypothetical protein [Butyrivibrio fibrisolvens]
MKLKRIFAVVMATTMIMGMSLTALAETPTSGASEGDGASEGHVDKEIKDVVLPTNTTGEDSPFAFIMDPERLIRATVGKNAKYEGFTFPAETGDTGVYFKNGTEYKNSSTKLQVVNKGAVSQKITVGIEKVGAATDIGLAAGNAAAQLKDSDDNPLLYLALVCAGQTKVVGDDAASVTVIVPGNDDNYEIKLKDDKSGYEYVKKATLADWKGIELQVDGAVGNAPISDTTTAPKLKVTWSFTDLADGDVDATSGLVDVADASDPVISSVTSFTKATPADVVISFTLGTGDKAVDANGVTLLQGASDTAVNTAKYTVNMTSKTVTIDKSAGFMTGATANVPIKVQLTKDGTVVETLTGTITIVQ